MTADHAQAHAHAHAHAHAEGDKHDHNAGANSRQLAIALGLTGTFLVAEIVGGFYFNSLALLSDAAHMFTDAAALAIALVAFRALPRRSVIARDRPAVAPTNR